MRRVCLLALFVAACPALAAEPLHRIAFGSGASQERPQPVWDAVVAAKPDLFLFLGDVIFGDSDNGEILRRKYAQLAAVPGYQRLIQTCPVLATWDGHDYGLADGGAGFPFRAASQKLFLDFFHESAESPRRRRPGVYSSWTFGPEGKRVQVILLDTRSFRGPSKAGQTADLLGDAQWQWLGEQLRQPADLRLLGTATPVIATDQPAETWANYPRERDRLFQLLRDTKATGVVILSGHRLFAELSETDAGVGYPLYDLTASGLNMASRHWRPAEPNRARVAVMPTGDNFGVVTIDWERTPPRVSLQVRDAEGDVTIQQKLDLATLQPGVLKTTAGPVATKPNPSGALTPAEAAKRVNEKVVLEMKVQTTGKARDNSRVFLNSAADFRDSGNFTVVLDLRQAADGLKAAGVADPLAYYRGKTVRVAGTVTIFRDAPQIVIEDVRQIVVVE